MHGGVDAGRTCVRVLYRYASCVTARVGVPTYARNRAGRRDLGRRQVNTPLTYAFFPLVPFALTLFPYNSSLSLSLFLPSLFALSFSVHVSPNLYRLPISLSTLPACACTRPTRKGSIVVTPERHFYLSPSYPFFPFFLSFSLFPFLRLYHFRGCARTCVYLRQAGGYLRLISPASILLLPHFI